VRVREALRLLPGAEVERELRRLAQRVGAVGGGLVGGEPRVDRGQLRVLVGDGLGRGCLRRRRGRRLLGGRLGGCGGRGGGGEGEGDGGGGRGGLLLGGSRGAFYAQGARGERETPPLGASCGRNQRLRSSLAHQAVCCRQRSTRCTMAIVAITGASRLRTGTSSRPAASRPAANTERRWRRRSARAMST